MKINLQEAADLVGGLLIGNTDIEISNISKIEEAQKGDLTFLHHPAYEKYLPTTKASVILIKPDTSRDRKDITYLEVADPHAALQKIIIKYATPEIHTKGIDISAQIDPSAKIGANVTLGKNVVISANCIVGDNTVILHNTVVMENVGIGKDTLIYPNVTVREDCTIGNNVIIHPGAVIGADGFGYAQDKEGRFQKIPQIGNVVIDNDVEIGANVTIDRAAMGSTHLKDNVKIDNLVQIAHNVVVGENTAIASQTGVSGSTKVGDNCILAGQVGVVGHIEITDGVIIGAQSGVSKSISKAGKYFGTPAKDMGTTMRLEAHIRTLPKYAAAIKALEEKIIILEEKIKSTKEKENS